MIEYCKKCNEIISFGLGNFLKGNLPECKMIAVDKNHHVISGICKECYDKKSKS